MAANTVTLRLRGLRTLQFRLWLGAKLCALGVWVIGSKFDVELATDEYRGKMVYRSENEPAPQFIRGDLWVQSGSGNSVFRKWDGKTWVTSE
jgi:hypothetical protein